MTDMTYGLGAQLKALRKSAKLTQADLASRIGLERTSITNIEGGKQALSVEKLALFAEATGYRVRVEFTPLSKPVKPKNPTVILQGGQP